MLHHVKVTAFKEKTTAVQPLQMKALLKTDSNIPLTLKSTSCALVNTVALFLEVTRSIWGGGGVESQYFLMDMTDKRQLTIKQKLLVFFTLFVNLYSCFFE